MFNKITPTSLHIDQHRIHIEDDVIKKEMKKYNVKIKIGAILFTDIVKSSNLWAKYKTDMLKAIIEHEKRMIKRIEDSVHKGVIVKTIGDAFMCFFEDLPNQDEFNGLLRAINTAKEIQDDLINNPILLSNEDKIKLRIGVAYGEVFEREVRIQKRNIKDYFGSTVNLASRMESKSSCINSFSFSIQDDFNRLNSIEFKGYTNVIEYILNNIINICPYINKIYFSNECEKIFKNVMTGSCKSIDKLNLGQNQTIVTFKCDNCSDEDRTINNLTK